MPEDTEETTLLNKAQIAQAFSVSEPTVEAWIADPSFPIEQRGSMGKAYKIDPLKVRDWLQVQEQAAEKEQAEKAAAIAAMQAQFDLRGGSAAGVDSLPFEKQRKYYDAEAARMQLAQKRRELMEVAEVQETLDELFGFIADQLQSLPDVLERKAQLTPEAVALVVEAVDAWQDRLASELVERFKDDDSAAA